jgi:hypothetical protein
MDSSYFSNRLFIATFAFHSQKGHVSEKEGAFRERSKEERLLIFFHHPVTKMATMNLDNATFMAVTALTSLAEFSKRSAEGGIQTPQSLVLDWHR